MQEDKICNGVYDCPDRSDESNCEKSSLVDDRSLLFENSPRVAVFQECIETIGGELKIGVRIGDKCKT